jgi:hypothetical protein
LCTSFRFGCLWTLRDKKVVGVFVRSCAASAAPERPAGLYASNGKRDVPSLTTATSTKLLLDHINCLDELKVLTLVFI